MLAWYTNVIFRCWGAFVCACLAFLVCQLLLYYFASSSVEHSYTCSIYITHRHSHWFLVGDFANNDQSFNCLLLCKSSTTKTTNIQQSVAHKIDLKSDPTWKLVRVYLVWSGNPQVVQSSLRSLYHQRGEGAVGRSMSYVKTCESQLILSLRGRWPANGQGQM